VEIVLYQPEIAGNVGAIIRLSANSGVSLNLIKPFGFDLQENKIRRAGLDYHDLSNTKTYNSWEEFTEKNTKKSICCLSSKGTDSYWDTNLNQYDFLLFGPESIGLPNEIISNYKTITIPMKENSRSINLANSVGIVVFESLRQASVQ
jgi:tRNA (cytidine/uridine-2'-O-)-methyltransferase|tara:strand:+ start:550 stop:993 length:444 start_codon:yes stop_codon:yes gene_type:complete